MTSTDQAKSAFEGEVARIYDSVPRAGARAIPDGHLAFPGFTTYEVIAGTYPVRGWARDDGTAVITRRRNFGPLLEAIGFRDPEPTLSAEEIARRLAWAHGPGYSLTDRIQEGECGATESLYLPPAMKQFSPGETVLRFVLKVHGDAEEPPSIIEYTIRGHADATYRVEIAQLAPPPPDDD